MEAACDCNWVDKMAETMVCEIMESMSGIQLHHDSSWEHTVDKRRIDAIHGFTQGDFQLELRFLAEPGIFCRLTRNMIGGEPEDEQEVQEYAMEFFNVLCGRFISELCKATGKVARFFPPRYERSPDITSGSGGASLKTLYFISDGQERAAFSWTDALVEDLLRRSTHGKA